MNRRVSKGFGMKIALIPFYVFDWEGFSNKFERPMGK
jgi:hypothetical protein